MCKVKTTTTLLVVLTSFELVLSTPANGTVLDHSCCPENDVLVTGACRDSERMGLKLNCSQGMYMLDPEMDDKDEFRVMEDGTLNFVGKHSTAEIQSGMFCTNRMQSGNTSQTKEVALVCFQDRGARGSDKNSFDFIWRGICGLISVLFVLATLYVYWVLPELRDLQGKCIIWTLISLLLGFLSLAIIQLSGPLPDPLCIFMAVVTYFWMISYFFWLNVVTINVWKTSVIVQKASWSEAKQFKVYCAYATGCPIFMTICVLAAQFIPGPHISPMLSFSSCWFHDVSASWLYFYGMVSALIVVNIILYVWACWKLWKSLEHLQESKKRSLKFKCKLYIKLFFITGITWIFEVLSFALEDLGINWDVTDVLNTLQGLAAFAVLVMFRPRVLRGLAARGAVCGVPVPARWRNQQDDECEHMIGEEGQSLSQTHRVDDTTTAAAS